MWELDLGSFISAAAAQKVYLSACVLTGALMCFFGRRLFKVTLGLFGALLGGYLPRSSASASPTATTRSPCSAA